MTRIIFSFDVLARIDDLIVYEHAGSWRVALTRSGALTESLELAVCTSPEAALAALRLLGGQTQ